MHPPQVEKQPSLEDLQSVAEQCSRLLTFLVIEMQRNPIRQAAFLDWLIAEAHDEDLADSLEALQQEIARHRREYEGSV